MKVEKYLIINKTSKKNLGVIKMTKEEYIDCIKNCNNWEVIELKCKTNLKDGFCKVIIDSNDIEMIEGKYNKEFDVVFNCFNNNVIKENIIIGYIQ